MRLQSVTMSRVRRKTYLFRVFNVSHSNRCAHASTNYIRVNSFACSRAVPREWNETMFQVCLKNLWNLRHLNATKRNQTAERQKQFSKCHDSRLFFLSRRQSSIIWIRFDSIAMKSQRKSAIEKLLKINRINKNLEESKRTAFNNFLSHRNEQNRKKTYDFLVEWKNLSCNWKLSEWLKREREKNFIRNKSLCHINHFATVCAWCCCLCIALYSFANFVYSPRWRCHSQKRNNFCCFPFLRSYTRNHVHVLDHLNGSHAKCHGNLNLLFALAKKKKTNETKVECNKRHTFILRRSIRLPKTATRTTTTEWEWRMSRRRRRRRKKSFKYCI